MTKLTLKDIIICVIASVLIFGLFCWAGAMDYQYRQDIGQIQTITK